MERWQPSSAGLTKAAERLPGHSNNIPLRDRIARYQQATQGVREVITVQQPAAMPRAAAAGLTETSAVVKYARHCLEGLAAVELKDARELERARALAALLYEAAQLP